MNNVRKVVILQNHICSIFCNISSSNSHSNTDVCSGKSRRIINSITSHGNNFALLLQGRDNTHFLVRRHSRENSLADGIGQLAIGHFSQFCTTYRIKFSIMNGQFPANSRCSHVMITCNHFHFDSSILTDTNGILHLRTWRIHDSN